MGEAQNTSKTYKQLSESALYNYAFKKVTSIHCIFEVHPCGVLVFYVNNIFPG